MRAYVIVSITIYLASLTLFLLEIRLAIFVDGCFWHGCPKHGSIPETNNEFWETKIKGNLERDIRVTNELIVLGWSVLRIWEHKLKDDANEVVKRILHQLGGKK